jgi:hypothetical protein
VLSDSIYTHAAFSRPSADAGDALTGWKEAWKSLQNHSARRDLEQAKAALRENLSEDNEDRLNALRNLREASDI